MPNFHEITNESNPQSVISKYINSYSEMTGRNVIVYYSGWLNHTHPRSGSSINDLDKNGFMSVIHGLDKSKGLDLFLHTPGGDVGATESLIDYLYDSFFTSQTDRNINISLLSFFILGWVLSVVIYFLSVFDI